MLFYLKKILSALVLPPFGLMLLALAGLCLSRRLPRLGRGMAIFALVALMSLSIKAVGDALIGTLETQPPISASELSSAQAIVILGGGIYSDAPEYGTDTVNRWTLERVRYGAYLQNMSHLPILVTGGAPVGGRPEADAMKAVIEEALHGQVQWVENASLDTADNARYSAAMLKAAGISRVALVSHAWHLRRATIAFESQGMTILPAPTGFTTSTSVSLFQALPSADALERSSIAVREWTGMLVQRLFH